MTVDTQAERASGAATATENFAAIPDIVGTHWFQYVDNPKGGRADGEDYDFGLVDINDQPYEELTKALAAANQATTAIHAKSAATQQEIPKQREFSIPYAEVDIADRLLKEWPKPASLMPPMLPSPGEVPFGEAYMVWNQAGLSFASIGQDYYDLDLLAYDGPFPLTEAYRVELGIDAGAGRRQFTLYFIPPKTKVKDHPPMAALLCAGPAAVVGEPPPTCHAIPGAKAVYFGADQPRITSEMHLPWSSLGLDGPPINGQLRLEVSSTAWHRSRWMSLSGLPPEQGRARPKRWMTVRLGRTS